MYKRQDLTLAANAPARFFRAGLGDTLAKYLESTFSARGDELGGALDHMSAIGVSLSSTCYDQMCIRDSAKARWFRVGVISCMIALPAFIIPFTLSLIHI